jgi:hypothetical protein
MLRRFRTDARSQKSSISLTAVNNIIAMNQMTTQEQSNLSGSKRKRCGEVEIDYQPVKKLKFEKTERISYGKGLEGSSHCLEVFVFSQLRPKPDGVLLNKLRTLTEKGKLSQKRIAKLIGARYGIEFIL